MKRWPKLSQAFQTKAQPISTVQVEEGVIAAAPERTRASLGGWGLAIVSAAAFGSAGPAARSLIDAGLSPLEVAWLRIAGAALVLFALAVRHRRLLARRPGLVLGYGLVAVAGVQVTYFAAISRLPIGVALLVEYLAPVLVLLWAWLVVRQRIPALAVVGVGLTVVGLALVVQVGRRLELDPIGLAFALGAAACLAGYFLLSATGTGEDVPPEGLIAQGLLSAAIVLTAVARPWDLPWRLLAEDGASAPAWLITVWLVLGGTVLAYLTVSPPCAGSRLLPGPPPPAWRWW